MDETPEVQSLRLPERDSIPLALVAGLHYHEHYPRSRQLRHFICPSRGSFLIGDAQIAAVWYRVFFWLSRAAFFGFYGNNVGINRFA